MDLKNDENEILSFRSLINKGKELLENGDTGGGIVKIIEAEQYKKEKPGIFLKPFYANRRIKKNTTNLEKRKPAIELLPENSRY